MFHEDSRENKTNCFPRDHTLSVYCNSIKSLKILLEVNFGETCMDQCLMS